MRVLTSAQMREADRRTIDEIGVPSAVLMENAGRQVVAAMVSAFDDLDTMRVAILCGRGNNGGDGFVVARVLAARGIDVGVYLVGRAEDVAGDARTNLAILRNLGLDIVEVGDVPGWELHGTDVLGADVIVDALFGTGLRAPLEGLVQTIVDDINSSTRPVVAIDLPSGLSADTPNVPGPSIDATLTVTLGAPKLPLVLPPGELRTGVMVVADIGIPDAVIDAVDGPRIDVLTRPAMRALIEPRSPDSHKGDFGRLLIVAGSPGKTGAAALAAMAALRSGAGLVTVAAPASSVAAIAAHGAEFMTLALDEAPDGTIAGRAVEQVLAFDADVIAAGPGLGRSPSVSAFVHVLAAQSGVPLVLDADALYAFAGEAGRLVGREGLDIVITPHAGEMARLVGRTSDEVQSRRLDTAREFAAAHQVHVILKGHRTIVASPDGRTSINPTGNAGMATAGAGDVLTGMVTAWLGQLLDADAATRLAVFLHGLAGDLAEADEGEVALMAGDILGHLGDAVLDLTARKRPATSGS
jgi:NAD(P)H-hydrate epimerase